MLLRTSGPYWKRLQLTLRDKNHEWFMERITRQTDITCETG